MPDTLKVMVVDDTITYRTILRSIVDAMPSAEVIATANNGKIALSKMQESPADLVLLDIEMPEMDGLETLQHLRQKYPDTGVIMVSGLNKSSADITIRALELGAIDFIEKPDGESLKQNTEKLQIKLAEVFQEYLKQVRSSIPRTKKAVATTSKKEVDQAQPVMPPSPGISSSSASEVGGKIKVIAIGASTGGPRALGEMLPDLPGNIGIPILITQHMPPLFTASLANSLDKKCSLTVKEAEDKEPVLPNTVYIAPGGRHMTVRKNKDSVVEIRLTDDPPEHSCCPAVDVLFRSVAETYPGSSLAVVMTGMGSDGALGVKAMKEKSCHSITQSEKSCVVYGMPQMVVKMQLSDEQVDLADLAARISLLVKQK